MTVPVSGGPRVPSSGLHSETLRMLSDTLAARLLPGRDRTLLAAAKRDLLPPGSLTDSYYPREKSGDAGIDLAVDQQLILLESFQQYGELFAKLRADREINPGFRGVDYSQRGLIHNAYYPTPDAEVYASMIVARQPERIIEVGSGYSTLVAKTAIQHAGLSTRVHVIDPQPRRSIADFADGVEYTRVEESSLATEGVQSGTLLFIDSSHICRRGGDLPHLFCKVLPALPARVLVHVHDVFLPYDYPDAYVERFYTEQYLLHCLLACSPRYRVVFATHLMSREHPEAMQRTFGPEIGTELFTGASFWFETV